MSLLMKALEKAAKDRVEVRKEPETAASTAAAPAAGRSELSLEPLRSEAPAATPAPGPRPAAGAPRAAAAPAREQAQAQAATIMQAEAAAPPAGGVGTYVRAHPLMVFGTLAALIAIGFGIYVYLQIFHPALLVRQAPAAPKGSLPPLTQAPTVPVPGNTPPALPSGPLLKEGASASAPSTGATEAQRAKPQPVAPLPVTAEEPQRSAISVSSVSAEPVLNPVHSQAYAALQAGRSDEARRLYSQVASAEPRNIDALLGLAAIAAQRGESEEASRLYLQILELDPRHALAQSGLIALLGRADPLAAESRLKQLIAREPSGHLHFTLGNLYADQSQWAAAQQAYFQAHHLEPANPDYAYNLAVALEHVSQPKLALGFYRRAAQLAAARGRANFNVPQAQARIEKLAAQVE